MTNTLYLNFGPANPSFIEVATRVIPPTVSGAWTRTVDPKPVVPSPSLAAPAAPAGEDWLRADRADLWATFAFAATLFTSALTASLFL